MDAAAAIRLLRDLGYAVAIYAPDELKGVDRDRLETVMTARGDDYINDHGDDEESDDD